MDDSLGEILHGRACVSEERASWAVKIEESARPGHSRLGVAFGKAIVKSEKRFFFCWERAREVVEILFRGFLVGFESLHDARDLAVVAVLSFEGFQIVESIGVEESQSSEVACAAELFRGRGEA